MKLRNCRNCGVYCWVVIIAAIPKEHAQGQTFQHSGQILPLSLGAYRNENNSAIITALRPAAGNWAPKKSVGIYAENRFMLKQVSDVRAALNLPIHSVLLSLSGHYNGTKFLSTQLIGAGIGLKLSSKLSTGIKISSHWLNITSVAPIHTMITDLGVLYRINNKVVWGIHIRKATNTNKTQKNSNEKPMLITGIGYTLNKQLSLSFELSTSSIGQLRTTTGVEWWATENFHVRMGTNRPLSDLYVGVGRKGKRETVSIGLSTHVHLGYSGALLLEYEL